MNEARRILIVRPSALGDVCRTVPVLASLRAAFPTARIDWVVQDSFAPAVAGHPALDQVIEFPRAALAAWWRNPIVAWRGWRWLASRRRAQYDLVFDCQGLGRSGLITLATRAAHRVGFNSAKEFAWLGYNVRHAEPVNADGSPVHTVDRMLALLEAQGIAPVRDMRLYVAEHEHRWWSGQRTRQRWPQGEYVVLAPTSRWPSKRWPVEHWRSIVAPLLARGIERVVVIGSPGEQAQAAGVIPPDGAAAARVVNLVGLTTIPQTMAVIAGAALVIANDSAPLHMAVGLGRPCIGLFGPTDPATVGPYRRPEAVIRAPGFGPGLGPGQTANFKDRALGDRLMRRIEPATVLVRIEQLLAEPRAVIHVDGEVARAVGAAGASPRPAALAGEVPGAPGLRSAP